MERGNKGFPLETEVTLVCRSKEKRVIEKEKRGTIGLYLIENIELTLILYLSRCH